MKLLKILILLLFLTGGIVCIIFAGNIFTCAIGFLLLITFTGMVCNFTFEYIINR